MAERVIMSIWHARRHSTFFLASEWQWHGHKQVTDMLMEKPYTDPTSWIGAYVEIQKEKWEAVLNGFEGCPYLEITNPYSGAYAWIKYKDGYEDLHDGLSTPAFFEMTLGVEATTYWWGFRGADPADFYGPGATIYSFTRLQLYRALEVYEEVGRRAAIVCSGGSLPGLMSGEEWVAVSSERRRRRRRLLEAGEAVADRVAFHKEAVRAAAPRFMENQVEHHATLLANSEEKHDAVNAECAPYYTTNCLMKHMGRKAMDGSLPSL